MNDISGGIIDIIRGEGRVNFSRYMEIALYHPEHGYYTRGPARTGWAGHYVTSAELHPSFGLLWGHAVRQVWEACGSPAEFHVIELGPGEGAFAAAILGAVDGDLATAIRYGLVERSHALAERQRALLAEHLGRVYWIADAYEAETVPHGFVIGNEVLDNQTVRVFERIDGTVHEMFVEAAGDGLRSAPEPVDASSLPSEFLDDLASLRDGGILEIAPEVPGLVLASADIVTAGALVFVDYGGESGELAARPGTVVCYSATGADADPLSAPGEKDITAHVNWSSVRRAMQGAGLEVTGPVPQREVLLSLGLRTLMDEAKERQNEALARGAGAEGFRAIAQRQALAALADTAGLGGLGVLVGTKGIGLLPFI